MTNTMRPCQNLSMAASNILQQSGQLGDVRSDPASLLHRQNLGRVRSIIIDTRQSQVGSAIMRMGDRGCLCGKRQE
jgi:hypothetical protein